MKIRNLRQEKVSNFGVLAAAAVMAISAHAQSVPLEIENGDFEADPVGTAGAKGWIIASDHFWTTDGSVTGGGLDPVSGADGTEKYLSPNRVAGGAGSNPASSFASQSVSIAAYAPEIDGGGVTLDVDYWYVTSKISDERTVISVEFFDSDGGSLGLVTTGDLDASPPPQGSWGEGTIADGAVPVPTLARDFILTLNLRRLGGSATNTGIDEVRASLNGVSVLSDLALSITINAEIPGAFDFEWNSRAGRAYDLVSSTDLTGSPDTWSVWEDKKDILATENGTNILSEIPIGDDKRFFAVIEKDPPTPG